MSWNMVIDEPQRFELLAPAGIEAAVELAARHGPDAALLAGGCDLLDQLKHQWRSYRYVINLKTVGGLRGIREEGGALRVGTLTTLAELAGSERIRTALPGYAQAASRVATPQIRNLGTAGGNLLQDSRCPYYRGPWSCYRAGGIVCDAHHGINLEHAIFGGDRCYTVSPSDTAPMLVALDAVARLHHPGGREERPLAELFVAPGEKHPGDAPPPGGMDSHRAGDSAAHGPAQRLRQICDAGSLGFRGGERRGGLPGAGWSLSRVPRGAGRRRADSVAQPAGRGGPRGPAAQRVPDRGRRGCRRGWRCAAGPQRIQGRAGPEGRVRNAGGVGLIGVAPFFVLAAVVAIAVWWFGSAGAKGATAPSRGFHGATLVAVWAGTFITVAPVAMVGLWLGAIASLPWLVLLFRLRSAVTTSRVAEVCGAALGSGLFAVFAYRAVLDSDGGALAVLLLPAVQGALLLIVWALRLLRERR